MALIIERDHKHGRGDLYVARAKEEGMGRGWKCERLTLEQGQAMGII